MKELKTTLNMYALIGSIKIQLTELPVDEGTSLNYSRTTC